MSTLRIFHNDPEKRLASFPLLDETIRAAVEYLDRYVVFKGVIDVAVNVESTPTGRFGGNGDISLVSQRNNIELWESALLAESRTGIDPQPNVADLTIFIDPSSTYLAQLWWDPAISTSLAANPPNHLTDAFTVVLHEILHGMGIVGWRNIETGALPGNYQSVWDSMVVIHQGLASFSGPAVVDLLGQPVEIRLGGSQGAFHLGNGPDVAASKQPWLEASNFNGYYYFNGERYTLGRLELALLQDIGWTLRPTTLVDVVNRWDDRDGPLYMVGWDDNEQLSGGRLADRIEGRGGNDRLSGHGGDDVLVGGAGADTLDGGAGNDVLDAGPGNDSLAGGEGNDVLLGGDGVDTVAYSGTRSTYVIGQTGGSTKVGSAWDGQDTLSMVERLVFSDGKVALDVEGAAGTVAKVLGVLGGKSALQNKALFGQVLDYTDKGATLNDLAGLAVTSGFVASLAGGADDSSLVKLIMRNVLGSDADHVLMNSLTASLGDGRFTKASLIAGVAQLDVTHAQIDLVGLSQTGINYV